MFPLAAINTTILASTPLTNICKRIKQISDTTTYIGPVNTVTIPESIEVWFSTPEAHTTAINSTILASTHAANICKTNCAQGMAKPY